MLCKHLRKLERALRGEGFKPALDSASWGALAKRQLCFDAALDRAALTRGGLISAPLRYREYGVAGQYCGFFCEKCACGISGYHPKSRERLRRDRGRIEGPFI